jgi:hypothetical protein
MCQMFMPWPALLLGTQSAFWKFVLTSELLLFGQDAQPRKLVAAGSVLSWEAPCTALERPLQYTILLRDTVTGKETYASLAPTKDVSLRYTVENLQVPRRTVPY